MPEGARRIADAIRGLMAERSVKQKQVAAAIDRTQGYVSERSNGVDAWTTLELSQIAELLGYPDVFTFMDEVGKRARP